MMPNVIVAGVATGNNKPRNHRAQTVSHLGILPVCTLTQTKEAGAWQASTTRLRRNVYNGDGGGLANRSSDFQRSREPLRPIVCLNG